MWSWFFFLAAAAAVFLNVEGAGAGAARLVCYVESARTTDGFSECTHLVYAGDARGDKLDSLLKEYRKNNPRLKIVVRVSETDKNLRALLKSKHVQGLELYDAHRSLNKTKVLETVEAARSAITSSSGGPLLLALPAHPELLAKYYDLRELMNKVDLMMVQTHALGLVKKMTYHPSRLSGLWDMMNTDSVVDLVVGLGVPASKLVISLPATARKFTLLNETLSTPGSPTLNEEPTEIDQAELCRLLQKGRWTLERDQDLSAPYAFKNKTWMSFEDSSSVDVKGKYARVRGLAGLALHKADRDLETPCGPTLKSSLSKVLNQQKRAPRGAVLRSLEHEILSAPSHARALDALQVSPYRITQVVDSDGVIHSIREDTRTEFSCSRQGYFVHPRSCARFYRCVKFDQLSPEYTVFEFDCPAGLAFDARYEVCVWPGSLPHSQACPGSSEIAPVPQTRFVCPEHEGYYADPENCRWFFACLDHGKAPLSAYEFRCPFGLGFDAAKLKCDWPWLVPACGNIARYEAEAYGYSGAALTGAAGFHGLTADAINVAAHQSLVSGASLDNLVGIQGGFLTKEDALDSNFIASQELANGVDAVGSGHAYQIGPGASSLSQNGLGGLGYQTGGVGTINANLGLVQTTKYTDGDYQAGGAESINNNLGLIQTTKYTDEGKYSSGSIILDDYRLPNVKATTVSHGNTKILGGAQILSGAQTVGAIGLGQTTLHQSGQYNKGYNGANAYSSSSSSSVRSQGVLGQYQGGASYDDDNSGAYVHDPSGDYAEPYRHVDSPSAPYLHEDSAYKQSTDYYDSGSYSGASSQSDNAGRYVDNNSGQYVPDNSGAYVESSSNNGEYNGESGSYSADYSVSYTRDNSGQYVAGVYRDGGHIGSSNGIASGVTLGSNGQSTGSIDIQQYHGEYSSANSGNYVTDSKAYTGASHTLTAGAVNVGLVGKTTLVDAGYTDQLNYQDSSQGAYSSASRSQSFNNGVVHQTSQPGHVSYVSQPAVSIKHVGTDSNNLDGYSYVTTPTSSGVPTTATPFAVTTALPAVTTYKTTYVPEAPRTSVKQIFGYTQPAVTLVQPTVVAVQQPQVRITDYNQGANYQYSSNYDSSSQNVGITASQASVLAGKSENGYDYPKPTVKFEDGISYTTAAPVVSVSTYKPQGFSHSQQTLHKVESVGFQYSSPTTVTEEPFKKLVAYTTGPSVTTFAQPTVSTYTPHSYSHQTLHKVESSKVYTPSVDVSANGFEYTKSGVAFEEPKTVVQYTTAQPAIAVQPAVSTYQPQVYSQQTVHKVDVSKVNTYSQDASVSGYNYPRPVVGFEETAKTVLQYSTPAPAVVTTYKPQSYSHQTIHKLQTQNIVPVSSTPHPNVELTYQQPAVSVYENPITKYTQKVTPVTLVKPTPTAYTQSYQPIINQHEVSHIVTKPVQYETSGQQSYVNQNLQLNQEGYLYNEPEIQRDIETLNTAKSYSDASAVSHQVFNQANVRNQYEVRNGAVVVSTSPSTLAYEDHYAEYESSRKPQTYKAPEYVPPKTDYQQFYSVASTASTPVVQHQSSVIHQARDQYDYKPVEYSQQFEPVQQTLPVQQVSFSTSHIEEPKKIESTHFSSFPGTTVTTKYNQAAYESPEIQVAYKSEEYLPPVVSTAAPVVFSTYRPRTYATVSTTREYLPPTPQPEYNAPEYLPPKIQTYSTPSSTVRPIIKSTTQVPTYKYVESTTPYQASEYLPPVEETGPNVVNFESFGLKDIDETSRIKYNPYQEYTVSTIAPPVVSSTLVPIHRKQNLVVETAKSNLLGFGTVGPDAGLVSPVSYTTSAPVIVSSTDNYSLSPKTVTSTYAPIEHGVIDVTPSPVPIRRTRPKVAVVTKINDFNPLLVRKLGAVCSCQSPVLVLKGQRANVQAQQISNDYNDDYNRNRGDINAGIQTPIVKTVTSNPVVTSTFSPIVVPEDSYYQDYQEPNNYNVAVTPKSKEIYSESFVSSTPIALSSTERVIKIRPRVKAVTVAPTYATVLLNQEVAPSIDAKESFATAIDSQSFDRYGPGGWRSRDETLQGTVDCQRAGLFRHPKQCNKFYACRWDCTKQRFTLHVFNCPVQLSFDPNLGACNWPSQGPACQGDTLLTNTL